MVNLDLNDDRTKAYLVLIDKLLSCSIGEEEEIIKVNRSLIDIGFVEIAKKLAVNQTQQNNEILAESFYGLAQMAESLTKSVYSFIEELLQNIIDNNRDPQVLYPLLQTNVEKLDENFARSFSLWATVRLSESESETKVGIAEAIGNFSQLILGFPGGNKACNQEIAIAGFQIVETIFTRELFAKAWAITQLSLGIVYIKRSQKDKLDNIRQAIVYCDKALEVFTRDIFCELWEQTQKTLGNAYTELGFFFNQRQEGKTAENLEVEMAAFIITSLIFKREVYPVEWARTQRFFADVCTQRIWGDIAENLEIAINAYKLAQQVHTSEEFPMEWAWVQNNLGLAYRDRIRGDKAENLEASIAAYQLALPILECEEYRKEWADTQINLGATYRRRINGNEKDNLKAAITAYQNALIIYTYKEFPDFWADIQMNLAVVYTDMIETNQIENLQATVIACQNALKVYTREQVPEKWGGVQQNLGCAYNKVGQIFEAIKYLWRALEIFKPTDYPLACLKTSGTLGNILFHAKRWHEAIEVYRIAIEAVQQRRNWATTYPNRQEIMEEVIEVYFNMVRSFVKTNQIQQALEYVERSKTRTLVELITNRKASTNAEVSKAETQVERLVKNIFKLTPHAIETVLLPELRQNLDKLLEKVVTHEDLTDLLVNTQSLINIQESQFISLPEIQDLLPDENTIIIEWFITDETVFTFVISKHNLWMAEPKDSKPLVQWANEYITPYEQNKKNWKNDLAAHLNDLSKILHLEEILFRIPKECDRLILVPHRFLHLFPLHALSLADGTCFLDRFSKGISYAPSCQLLQITQKSKNFDLSRLFAIQDPEQNLPFANSLVETIGHYFQEEACVIVREAATRDALNDSGNIEKMRLAHCVIFSGHGEYILKIPEQSCLKLANNTRLMMGEIFDLDLSQCQLLILSACETGLTYPNSFSDEYIGLASGFIFAGCSNIVHSLWEVNSISTTLLIGELFKNILTEFSTHQRLDVASALKKAQKWLRELSSERCQEILDNELKPQINHIIPMLPPRKQRIFSASLKNAENQIRAQPYPFASPYYWAAFITTGI